MTRYRMSTTRHITVLCACLLFGACSSATPQKVKKEVWEEDVWEAVDMSGEDSKRNGLYKGPMKDDPVLPLSEEHPCVSNELEDTSC